jgi:phenylalanyl-tRNA synthetase alpha chain
MHSMDIQQIKNELKKDIENIQGLNELETLRIKYLGRKGIIAGLTSGLSKLGVEQRRAVGQEVNALKNQITLGLKKRQEELKNIARESNLSRVDIGLPGIQRDLGSIHPITKTIEEICSVFIQMGFAVVEGPEIETEYNNFTGLNIPLDHPSRDVFDTFYVKTPPQKEKLLLRSHTSPVQIRVMKSSKPPLAVVVPGRVYRPDAVDASHSFMFSQIEGFAVDQDISFTDLKGTLTVFAKNIFGDDIKMRFRPHFFPFTEPSAEVDISCIICKGKGCSVCGKKGWLEILGAGMIHPRVFKNVGYDPSEFSGFAFGMGIERIAMLKYGIDDIRLFFDNDLRFLKQF